VGPADRADRADRAGQGPRGPSEDAVHQGLGAILLEAIDPGTPLDQAEGHPDVESLGSVIEAFQIAASADDRPVADRIRPWGCTEI
jgi:hypothetical protein